MATYLKEELMQKIDMLSIENRLSLLTYIDDCLWIQNLQFGIPNNTLENYELEASYE